MASPSPGRAGPGDHYFTAEPSTPSQPRTVEVALPDGLRLRLATDAGVFSADAVDPGTRVLLAEGPPVAAGRLLDLGCGYGPIAIALALRAPDAEVWAVDVNERARALCRQNAAAAGVGDRIHVAAPEDVPTDLRFAQLWSNPPIRIGKAALHTLLHDWLDRLTPDGHGVLVVSKHLGADSLAAWLNRSGHPTERLISRMAYRVLCTGPRPTLAEGLP